MATKTELKPTVQERVEQAIEAVGWLVDNYNGAKTERSKQEAFEALDQVLTGSPKRAETNLG